MDMRKKIFVSLAFLCFGVLYCASQSTPATVPYFCGFEESAENSNWILNAGNAAIVNLPRFSNKWIIGSGAQRSGKNGLYIASVGSSIPQYTEAAMYTIAYREFALAAGTYDLAFSWRALGEKDADEMIVYWMPATVATNSNLTSSAPSALNPYRIAYVDVSLSGLSGAAAWRYAVASVRVPTDGQAYKLVFLWRNNATRTYNPGGCIDNVQLVKQAEQSDQCGHITTNIHAVENDGTLTVTWNPTPNATYELLYWLNGSIVVDTISGLTTSSCQISTKEMDTGLYTIWVRAFCSDGRGGLYGETTNVKIIGDGNTLSIANACPELSFFSSGYDKNGYKILLPQCDGSDFTIKPTIVGGGSSIAGYRVEPIVYNPPFPLDAGQPFKVKGGWADDVWSDIVKLPFSFCFFDGTYNQAQVGANGLITFNTDFIGGESRCEWMLTDNSASGEQPIPLPDIPNRDFEYKNSIFGVYEDGHAGSIESGGIYYGVLGEYPCRTFTVSWDRVPTYGSVTGYCTPRKENSYQIVLYEGTNVIDVYIKNRHLCSEWNGGVGIVGIINADGTEGMAAPGRNLSDNWAVDAGASEAWRFVPLTTPTYTMTWYEGVGFNGRVLGHSDSLILNAIQGIDTLTVRMQFSACNGDYFDLSDVAIIDWQRTDTLASIPVYICEGSSYSDKYIQNADTVGMWETAIKNRNGCDSLIYRVEVDIFQPRSRVKDTTICYGETYVYNGMEFKRTGEYPFTHKYENGCDSLYDTLKLTVLPHIQYTLATKAALSGPNSGSIQLTMTNPTDYYTLNGKKNVPLDALSEGSYELIVYNEYGCASTPQTIEITTECLETSLLPLEQICADDRFFTLPLTITSGLLKHYSLIFDDKALAAGFENVDRTEVKEGAVIVSLPVNVIPGHYSATLMLHDMNCEDKVFPFEFSVLYKASTVEQKWNDVLAVLNSKYNGGYEFSSFRWYRNGEPLSDNGSYLYLGMGNSFSENDYYQVGLVRQNETEEVLTCPIWPKKNVTTTRAMVQNVPGKWNVSAPGIIGATVNVRDVWGNCIDTQRLENEVIDIPMPIHKGIYLIELLPDNGRNRIVLRAIVD